VLKAPLVCLSCLALLLPGPWLQAAGPPAAVDGARTLGANAPNVSDVELDGAGRLRGLVLDAQGIPLAGARVMVCQGTREMVAVTTDGLGRFAVGPMRGGSYLLKSGGQGKTIRAWRSMTAPPLAKPLAVMIVGDGIVRGQMPLEDFFASDAVVVAGLVAAMIAIPIAVHNSGSKRPASP
jgi:hypothetical protein